MSWCAVAGDWRHDALATRQGDRGMCGCVAESDLAIHFL